MNKINEVFNRFEEENGIQVNKNLKYSIRKCIVDELEDMIKDLEFHKNEPKDISCPVCAAELTINEIRMRLL